MMEMRSQKLSDFFNAIFQMADVAIPRDAFAAILNMINTLRGPPAKAVYA